MKRFLSAILILAVLSLLFACSDVSEPSYSFIGKVKDAKGGEYFIEVTELLDSGLSVGEPVIVHYDENAFAEYGTGEYLKIEFDGKVALSYPAQISRVFSIWRVER